MHIYTKSREVEKSSFVMILGSISLLGDTPGASRAAWGDQVGSQVDFLMVSKCPGVSFGNLVIPLGTLGLALGRPWASLWRQKWA